MNVENRSGFSYKTFLEKEQFDKSVSFRLREFFILCFRRFIHWVSPNHYIEKIKRKVTPLEETIKANVKAIEGFAKQQAHTPFLEKWKEGKLLEQKSLQDKLKFQNVAPQQLTFNFHIIHEVKMACKALSQENLQNSYQTFLKEVESLQKLLTEYQNRLIATPKKEIKDLLNQVLVALNEGDKDAKEAVKILNEIQNQKESVDTQISQYLNKSTITETNIGNIYRQALEEIETQFLENLDIRFLPNALKQLKEGQALNLNLIKREKIYIEFEDAIRSCFECSKSSKDILKQFKSDIEKLEQELKDLNLEESSKEWLPKKLQKKHLSSIYNEYMGIEKALESTSAPFDIVRTCGNGSCLYDSLIKAIEDLQIESHSYLIKVQQSIEPREILRKKIAEYIGEYVEIFKDQILNMLGDEYNGAYKSGYFSRTLPQEVQNAFNITRKADLLNEKRFRALKTGNKKHKKTLEKLWDMASIENHILYLRLPKDLQKNMLECWQERSKIITDRVNWLEPYIKGMSVGYSYGGPVEVSAFSMMTQLPIRIYTSRNFKNFIDFPSETQYDSQRTIHLLRLVSFSHYEYLKPRRNT